MGVKHNSMLNAIKYFHVASPALPPCQAHDLFEGVVQYDMALILQYFEKKTIFTIDTLNKRICTFQYNKFDMKNMPGNIKNKVKIGGQAVQTWCLLRLLPLIIGDKLVNEEDPVYQTMLKLEEIIYYIRAPKSNCLFENNY